MPFAVISSMVFLEGSVGFPTGVWSRGSGKGAASGTVHRGLGPILHRRDQGSASRAFGDLGGFWMRISPAPGIPGGGVAGAKGPRRGGSGEAWARGRLKP
ncbi:hypothetical protein DC28_03735 [Spirochaeta lutea]|uniref:Uncharacterized protein n=1 Tax=Spirochaeta lutea TaxID=1480694 RepID=A0A098QZV5_9SPIO|nr:hypothetical protein DC28_03735 [Spirochaeta lutea]